MINELSKKYFNKDIRFLDLDQARLLLKLKNIMTAEQARTKAHNFLLQSTEGEYQTILKKIEEKVNNGEFSLYITRIHELVKAKLVNDGYNVTYNQGDFRDQREGSSYTISWK